MASTNPRPAGRPTAFGLTLIVVGIVLLANSLLQGYAVGLGGWVGLAGPGVIFLAVYFFLTRHQGLLILGALLTALGLFFAVQGVSLLPESAGLFFLFFGLPFLFVWAVHTRKLAERAERTWPLFPGAVLTGLGVVFLVLETGFALGGPDRLHFIRLWPLVLVVIGLIYLLKGQTAKPPG
jgi:hypothetical protein